VIIKILKQSQKKNPLKMRRSIKDLEAISIGKELNSKGTRDN